MIPSESTIPNHDRVIRTKIIFFDELPLELINHIFSFIDEPCSLSMTNRGCHELAKLWYEEKLKSLSKLNVGIPDTFHNFKRTMERLHFIAGHFFCDKYPDHNFSPFERYRWECTTSPLIIAGISKELAYHYRINSITMIRLISMKLNIDLPQPFYGMNGIGIKSEEINEVSSKVIHSGKLSSLTKLNASHQGLFFIPNFVTRLSNLEILTLGCNLIFQIPRELSVLGNLKKLNLQHNFLTDLPKEFGMLTNLTKVNVGYNHLRKIPKCIFELTNLQKFLGHANHITKISKRIKNLTSLVELNLNRNQIRELPYEIHKLQNLRELLLICNKIERLPDSFPLLTELKTVWLSGNPLKSS